MLFTFFFPCAVLYINRSNDDLMSLLFFSLGLNSWPLDLRCNLFNVGSWCISWLWSSCSSSVEMSWHWNCIFWNRFWFHCPVEELCCDSNHPCGSAVLEVLASCAGVMYGLHGLKPSGLDQVDGVREGVLWRNLSRNARANLILLVASAHGPALPVA